MKKTRIFSIVLAVLMALSCLVISVAADEGIAKADNVVFVANAGSDDAAGTAEAPLATMQKAVEKLQLDGGVIVHTIKTSGKIGWGFDAYNEEYCDMVACGIVDPTKVTRSALQNP